MNFMRKFYDPIHSGEIVFPELSALLLSSLFRIAVEYGKCLQVMFSLIKLFYIDCDFYSFGLHKSHFSISVTKPIALFLC